MGTEPMKERKPPAGHRQIPAPPHPVQRRAPLPGCRPKPDVEDPSASARVRAIMDSPAYREACLDLDFLTSWETRGTRLELDYLKAELQLQKHGVTDTIVVFGSTRLAEPSAAAARLQAAKCALAARPGDAGLVTEARRAQSIFDKSYVDGSRLQGFFWSLGDSGQVQSYVRPFDAAHMAAGPDGVRGSGPYQCCALRCALIFSGLPDLRLDRSPSLPLHPRILCGLSAAIKPPPAR